MCYLGVIRILLAGLWLIISILKASTIKKQWDTSIIILPIIELSVYFLEYGKSLVSRLPVSFSVFFYPCNSPWTFDLFQRSIKVPSVCPRPTFAVTRLWDLVMFSKINFHLLEENSMAQRNGDKNWENQKSSACRFQDGR